MVTGRWMARRGMLMGTSESIQMYNRRSHGPLRRGPAARWRLPPRRSVPLAHRRRRGRRARRGPRRCGRRSPGAVAAGAAAALGAAAPPRRGSAPLARRGCRRGADGRHRPPRRAPAAAAAPPRGRRRCPAMQDAVAVAQCAGAGGDDRVAFGEAGEDSRRCCRLSVPSCSARNTADSLSGVNTPRRPPRSTTALPGTTSASLRACRSGC